MSELLTTNERISKLEQKIDDLRNAINPVEVKPDDAIMQELEQLADKIDKLAVNKSQLNGDYIPEDVLADSDNLYRNAWIYVGVGFSVSAILTAITYNVASAIFFFPLAFSLFFTYSMMLLGLAHDWYFIPGNTLRRIASNAISASMLWLVLTFLTVAGFAIGTTIISDPFGGEEGNSKSKQVRYIDDPATRESSEPIRVGEGNASEE